MFHGMTDLILKKLTFINADNNLKFEILMGAII